MKTIYGGRIFHRVSPIWVFFDLSQFSLSCRYEALSITQDTAIEIWNAFQKKLVLTNGGDHQHTLRGLPRFTTVDFEWLRNLSTNIWSCIFNSQVCLELREAMKQIKHQMFVFLSRKNKMYYNLLYMTVRPKMDSSNTLSYLLRVSSLVYLCITELFKFGAQAILQVLSLLPITSVESLIEPPCKKPMWLSDYPSKHTAMQMSKWQYIENMVLTISLHHGDGLWCNTVAVGGCLRSHSIDSSLLTRRFLFIEDIFIPSTRVKPVQTERAW